MSKIIILISLSVIFFFSIFLFSKIRVNTASFLPSILLISPTISPSPSPTPSPLPQQKFLTNEYHVFQTFNNCGPAALSMALSYFGIKRSQEILGNELRPYQNPRGDNDDKSVTLEEIARKASELGLITYHRPRGDIDLLKKFTAENIPVITRTLLKIDDDIGHYRVVKGYDDINSRIIQDDSLQGKNLQFAYEDFLALWKIYNFEYLVLVTPAQRLTAESILGEDTDEKKAWEKAVIKAEEQLNLDETDLYARLNLSVALYNSGRIEESVLEFEKIEGQLPFRTLWYQIEPLEAYFALGDYQKVFSLTDKILNNYNRAFSELYLMRGEIYRRQGNTDMARQEFEKALFYNKNLIEAQEALISAD